MAQDDGTIADPRRGEDLGSILEIIDVLAERIAGTAEQLGALQEAIRTQVTAPTDAPPDRPHLRTVVDADADDETRLRALRGIRLDPQAEVTVIVLLAEPAARRAFLAGIRAHTSRVLHADLDGLELVLARGLADAERIGVPVGARAAYAPAVLALDAPDAWDTACRGLRFALPSRHDEPPYALSEAVLVNGNLLGAHALLADALTQEQLDTNAEVRRINQLVSEQGEDMLVWLEAVAATDSLRKAAAQLFLHHNSVAYRVERAERYLGYRFTEPYGRNRLMLALVLRRLQDSRRLMPSHPPHGRRVAPSDR